MKPDFCSLLRGDEWSNDLRPVGAVPITGQEPSHDGQTVRPSPNGVARKMIGGVWRRPARGTRPSRGWYAVPVFRLVLHTPEIPPNTGNVIRLAANTGVELHLIRPLGFSLDERHVRRAGLDYRDLADVVVHAGTGAFATWIAEQDARVFAFTAGATTRYTDVTYAPGDVLLFGRESTGLPPEVARAGWVTDRVGLPMRPSNRSLNLANAAAVAVYEAWRQRNFA